MLIDLPEGAIDAPAAKNPQDHPDYLPFSGFTQEEINKIYAIMDFMNDEAYVVEKYGSMTCTCDYVDANGETYDVNVCTLLNTDYGLMSVSTNESVPGFTFYNVPNHTVVCSEGAYSLIDGYADPETHEQVWHHFHFPYIPFDHFVSIRGDGKTGFYILAESTQGYLYEYVTDILNHIAEIRRYVPDENGDFLYNGHCTYSAEAFELPGEVVDLLAGAGED